MTVVLMLKKLCIQLHSCNVIIHVRSEQSNKGQRRKCVFCIKFKKHTWQVQYYLKNFKICGFWRLHCHILE
jgi:hypothetical protein